MVRSSMALLALGHGSFRKNDSLDASGNNSDNNLLLLILARKIGLSMPNQLEMIHILLNMLLLRYLERVIDK